MEVRGFDGLDALFKSVAFDWEFALVLTSHTCSLSPSRKPPDKVEEARIHRGTKTNDQRGALNMMNINHINPNTNQYIDYHDSRRQLICYSLAQPLGTPIRPLACPWLQGHVQDHAHVLPKALVTH